MHFPKIVIFHSRKFKKREWKTHKIKKGTPRHQKPGSAKPIESRNTLPNVQTKGVEKSKNQEMHSLKPKSKECISPKNKKYAPDHQNQRVQKPKKQETRSRRPTTTIEEECKTSISQKTLSSVNPECGWIGASGLRELKKLRNRFNQCLTGLILRDMKYCMKGGMQWMCN